MAVDKKSETTSRSTMFKNIVTLLQPHLEDSLLHQFVPPEGTAPIYYADFGCGSGATPLAYAKFVVQTLKKRFGPREVVCQFADLPSNDFNSLFQLLVPGAGAEEAEAEGGGEEERTWFPVGVPGSQFGRMFPRNSLHVAIATISLMFLPEVPASVRDKASPAYNKGHMGVHGSSPATAAAFAEASRKALRRFFECRAEEMAPGGVLAFYCTGRQDQAHPEVQFPDNTMNFSLHVEKAWKDLVNEGVIPEERLDSFNGNAVSPSVDDIREAVEHPSSDFHIQKLEYIPDFSPFAEDIGETVFTDEKTFAGILSNMVKGGMSSMVSGHLGPELTEALFERLRQNFERDYAQWKAVRFFKPVPLCLAVLIRK